MTVALFGTLFLMLLLTVPIAISMGVAVLVALYTSDAFTPLLVIVQRMFTAVDNFPFMAVPFFILAGNLMEKGGISKRLISFSKMILGKLPASLAIITTAASAFFGAISGSNPATVAAIGGLMVPEMVKVGYPKDKAAAIAASSGTLGVIIPPSISMVTYGVTASVSVGTMFIAGIIPGLLLASGIIITSIITCRQYEEKDQSIFSLKAFGLAFKDAIWALLMPVIILGGIYGGIFTPTEASSVSCIYALIVSRYIYKEISYKDLPKIFSKSATSTAVVLFIVALSAPFSWLMTSAGLPTQIAQTMLGTLQNRFLILFMINVVLLLLGCFLETQSIILLMTPMLLPLAAQLGIHPVALGIIMIINTSIGMITPPMAVNLFVATEISKITLEQISKRILPFLFAETLVLLLLTYFSDIIMWLPSVLS
ncbi:TRAP transporter large permease [Clostridium formicaceticum]|uniref:C4-dicarboxylate ABC transporter permease n=1 Tax=Clostridium formicaceticum TaxID=1497 RepID=A0AAC9WJH1_9CLOT|nr:TRAP transporter large permease [Clostridium formicaceticum]AOY74973.1 C4-dicarboxylate ABC transporter permease [Clostridium formicaceticum]ARE89385.1 Sialic acid TRAP transporter permease protein SiaT [Clostridium formicaceticum]